MNTSELSAHKSEYIEGKGPVSIFKNSSPNLSSAVVAGMDLPDLLTRGFAMQFQTERKKFTYTRDHYTRDDIVSYFAVSGGKAVSSATCEIFGWGNKYAGFFWSALANSDPHLMTNLMAFNKFEALTVIRLSSVVTLPEWQNKGIQAKILTRAFDDQRPPVAVAETRSPKSAKVIAKAAWNNGYQTFLGDTEITPGVFYYNEPPEALSRAHLALFGRMYLPKSLFSYDKDQTRPDIPQVEGFSEPIIKAFTPLIEKQMFDKRTAYYLPLIAIKKGSIPHRTP